MGTKHWGAIHDGGSAALTRAAPAENTSKPRAQKTILFRRPSPKGDNPRTRICVPLHSGDQYRAAEQHHRGTGQARRHRAADPRSCCRRPSEPGRCPPGCPRPATAAQNISNRSVSPARRRLVRSAHEIEVRTHSPARKPWTALGHGRERHQLLVLRVVAPSRYESGALGRPFAAVEQRSCRK